MKSWKAWVASAIVLTVVTATTGAVLAEDQQPEVAPSVQQEQQLDHTQEERAAHKAAKKERQEFLKQAEAAGVDVQALKANGEQIRQLMRDIHEDRKALHEHLQGIEDKAKRQALHDQIKADLAVVKAPMEKAKSLREATHGLHKEIKAAIAAQDQAKVKALFEQVQAKQQAIITELKTVQAAVSAELTKIKG